MEQLRSWWYSPASAEGGNRVQQQESQMLDAVTPQCHRTQTPKSQLQDTVAWEELCVLSVHDAASEEQTWEEFMMLPDYVFVLLQLDY